MCGSDDEVALGFAARRFPLNTHICFLYDGTETRDGVLGPYLSSGIAQFQYIEFFADVDEIVDLDPRIRGLGLADPDKVVAITATRKYCPEGVFCPGPMLERLRDVYDTARGSGFAGGRVFAEMSWALRGFPGSDDLVEYEARINDLLVSAPMTVLCAYDARRFSGDLLADVVAVHPMTLSAGALIGNKHFLTVDEYMQSRRQ
ncbi:MAG: MEthanogen/methylotroph, DcmR Sensory domain [Xanthomonadaceae bacterium]|nr:MEthanogen/methylotroph, DcmR Sensory domain [Xanthomonadaceae bacterium]